jgi:hypothetical protein
VRRIRFVLLPAILAACADAPPAPAARADDGSAAVQAALRDGLDAAQLLADSIDDLLLPVPLLTPAQEAALRRYGNDAQLVRARALGTRPQDSAHVARLTAAGDLVPIADSTEHWVVRELDHSLALATPDVVALLERIGTAFHDELAQRGLPPFRLEVTSVLRTPESQADLRRTNVNAAAGTSTHEFGTTVDIAYSSFAAPAVLPLPNVPRDVEWLAPELARITAAMLERAAARKSREMQAILGDVLLELQNGGVVYVTLERQQPVYHLTVARRLR